MTEESQDWEIVKDIFKKSWPVLSAFAVRVVEFIKTSVAYTKVHFLKKIYDMMKSGATLSSIKNELSNAPETCRTIADDVDKCLCTLSSEGTESLCSELERMMQKQFNIVSIVMFLNALNALSQSLITWHTLWKYQIKTFERKMDRVKKYMEEAINLLAMVIDEITQRNSQAKIERALQHLEDAKVILQDICDDIEEEIRDVKNLKNNTIQQSVVNAISLVSNMISISLFPPAAVAGWGAVLAGASISIHSACTIGNLIAAGHAQDLLDQLKVQLANMQKTEVDRQMLENRLRELVM